MGICPTMRMKETKMQLNLSGLGAILAVIVLVLCVVLVAVGQMPVLIGVLIAALALARLT